MKTDSQLQQDVHAELQWEPTVHAAHIGVEVKDGMVTLAGQVESPGEKWNAEHVAQQVSGVMALTSQLKVRLSSLDQRSDSDIAESVENVLGWTSSVPADAVSAMVEGGWVTLSGVVDWQYQRLAAVNSIRDLLGVTGVSNLIGIKPQVTPETVKADIEAALQRALIADASKISVEVRGSRVTLSGNVHSWDERDAATHVAWGNPGVYNVVDTMTLVR